MSEITKTGQMIKDLGCYEYEASDRTIIKLRTLSETERTEILQEDFMWVSDQCSAAMKRSDRELWRDAHRGFVELMRTVGFDLKQVGIVAGWTKRGHIQDVFGLLQRIADVESARRDKETPPDQLNLLDETELATDSPGVLEAKGEDLPGDSTTPTI